MSNLSIWGIGAFWSDSSDPRQTETFIQNGYAQLGWNNQEAPAYYELLRRIEPGDIIYIKSCPPGNTLHIYAIGKVLEKAELDKVRVKWLSTERFQHPLTEAERRYNVYMLTLYEELNPTIRWEIKQHIIDATD